MEGEKSVNSMFLVPFLVTTATTTTATQKGVIAVFTPPLSITFKHTFSGQYPRFSFLSCVIKWNLLKNM